LARLKPYTAGPTGWRPFRHSVLGNELLALRLRISPRGVGSVATALAMHLAAIRWSFVPIRHAVVPHDGRDPEAVIGEDAGPAASLCLPVR